MSRVVKQSVVCPECRERSDIDMWESVNVTLNPEMYEKVRDGSIFDYKCEKCGFKSQFVYPMLYHDMEKKQLIQICTTQAEAEAFKKFLTDVRSGKTAEAGGDDYTLGMPDYTIRIVPTYDKLREKLFIFDAGLDDRVIELCKSMLWKIVTDEGNSVDRLCYCFTKDAQDGSKKVMVQFFKEGGGSGAAEIDMEMYNDIKENINVGAAKEQFVINEEWADDITGLREQKDL